MSSRFVQPTDGKTNTGDPMTFEFAGDDDVWVFIDDVLVGDIGGIHSSAKLTIDFQTGEIKVNDSLNGTLLRKFKEAGRALRASLATPSLTTPATRSSSSTWSVAPPTPT